MTSWALLAQLRQPQFGECVSASELWRRGLADGMVQLFDWACGTTARPAFRRHAFMASMKMLPSELLWSRILF